MGIQVKDISKKFGDFVALSNVSLEVRSGELIALLGPSGSGKTSLLRIIAGLEKPDTGTVILDGREAVQKDIRERHVGFVFQHYALFKHMTVFENVAFGLRVRPKDRRPTEPEIRKKVMALLELVHLETFHNRYPSQLSGGQRQRVALARALAVEPKVLLLDEPFGALDAKVRKELRRWLRKLHDEIHVTSIFVTHDQEEAMEVADRVVVMNEGKIEQMGSPEEVYHNPVNGFVYDFLGNYNEFLGWRDSNGKVHLAEDDVSDVEEVPEIAVHEKWENRYPEIAGVMHKILPKFISKPQLISMPSKKRGKSNIPEGSKPVRLFARPHEMYISRKPEGAYEYLPVKVLHINPAGSLAKMDLERRNGKIIQAEVPKQVLDSNNIKKHDEVFVRPKHTRIFE